MIPDLDGLLAPIGAAAFFAEHYERRPLHLAADRNASRVILTQDELLRALAAAGRVPDELVIFPEHAGATAEALVSDGARLAAYLEAGHPLVWNRARGIGGEVDAVAALIGEAFGAHAWPNVYATGSAGTPFDVHFDAHEVIALQCEGDKEWTISEVRVDRPLDAVEMAGAVRAALTARRDEAASRTLCTFTAKPGDLVYVPRGQFHNARSLSERSLHVTFGIELPSGFDLARRILLDLLGDPLLRELLPPVAADPGGERTAALLGDIAGRLQPALGEDGLRAASADLRALWAQRDARLRRDPRAR